MADNELKEQLDNLVATGGKPEYSFFQNIAYGADPLAGFDEKDLESLQALIPADHNLRSDILARIEARRNAIKEAKTPSPDQTLNDTPNPTEQPSSPVASDEKQPTSDEPKMTIGEPMTPVIQPEIDDNTPQILQDEPQTVTDSPQQDNELAGLQFVVESSYSKYKLFEKSVELYLEDVRAGTDEAETTPYKEVINDLVTTAQNVIESAEQNAKDEGGLSPDSAVFLKDYMEILRKDGNFDDKYKDFEAEIDKQLEIFDEENGLNDLKDIKAKTLEIRENLLYSIGDEHIKAKHSQDDDTESNEIIKNLIVQEMKISDIDPVAGVLNQVSEKLGIPYETLEELYNKGEKKEELPPEQQKVYDNLKETIGINANLIVEEKIYEFAKRFEELKEEMEATKAIERVKLSAEELYPDSPDMSDKQLEEQRKKREKYLEEQLVKDGGLKSEQEWINESILNAFKRKYEGVDIDGDFVKEHAEEYEELRQAYTNRAKEISEATNAAYVVKIDLLANRTARITGAQEVNPNTQKFLNDFANKHPKSYVLAKAGISVGKSVVLSQGMKAAFGFKGMAAYSAYNTSKLINKSWNNYKKQAEAQGNKTSLAGFWGYLKENKSERDGLIGGVAKTAVMSTLAIAGTAMGFDNIPGLSSALVGTISGVTAAAKAIHDRKKIKQSFQEFKEKHLTKSKLKKYGKLGGIIAGAAVGLAAAGYAAYKAFAPDEVKDAVDSVTDDLANGNPNLSGGKGLDYQSPDELRPDATKDMGLGKDSVRIGAENPKFDDVTNGGSDAVDAAQAAADQYADFDLYSDPQTVNNINQFVGYPAFSAQKLHELGLIDAKTADELSGTGGTSKTLAKLKELNENATPEEKAKLAEYKEWINDRSARNAEIIKYNHEHGIGMKKHIDEVRNKIAENNNTSQNTPVVAEDGQSQEVTKVGIRVNTDKAFVGITTKHNVASDIQEVESTGDVRLDQRNAAIAQHQATGAKHMTTEYTDENGNVISSGKYTVRGNVENNSYTVSGKVVTGGEVHKESIKVEGSVTESHYSKGVEAGGDIDGDGKNDKILRTVKVGNQEFAAVKGTAGGTYLVDENSNVMRDDKAVQRVKDIAQTARNARMGRE